MDLMEQIRLEAWETVERNHLLVDHGLQTVGASLYESGAQALLNLLGRSATSEERETFLAEHDENVRLHTELEQEREARKGASAEKQTWEKAFYEAEDKFKVERARNARLTAALERIASGIGMSNPEDSPEVAREALGEAGKAPTNEN